MLDAIKELYDLTPGLTIFSILGAIFVVVYGILLFIGTFFSAEEKHYPNNNEIKITIALTEVDNSDPADH
ncbi:MAG: hypothetical protein PHT87_03645 [Bacteroidales bacterium]|nr:hypothetical protein [Bacteroidales bacterium]MDD4641712.1 hypothetical protein [Bacteroidales bacterium]